MNRETSLFSGRPSELVGQQIAGYRIEQEIGRGGMAVVYRARDLRLERTVALKLLAPELARNDTFRRAESGERRLEQVGSGGHGREAERTVGCRRREERRIH